LSEFNQLLDFFNLFDSRLVLTLLYDSLSRDGTGSGFLIRDPTRPGRFWPGNPTRFGRWALWNKSSTMAW